MKIAIYTVIIFALLSYVFFKQKGVMEYMELSEKYSRICEENRKLAKENAKLISIIEKLKTDRSYIEKIAREKYNMIKRDEILIKIEKKGGGK